MEEFAFTEEGLAEGVEEEGLAEASGAGEEEVSSLFGQFFDKGCLINIVIVISADFGKALDADRELFHNIFLRTVHLSV